MKVLHVTNWYPNKFDQNEAIWIKNQIDSLEPFVDEQFTLHLEIKPSKRYKKHTQKAKAFEQYIYEIPVNKWRIIEVVNHHLLKRRLKSILRGKHFDIINFHIAYPQLVGLRNLMKSLPQHIVITEHWSAYHFMFGLDNPIPRIQNIFKLGTPVIAVSKALSEDIKTYSQADFHSFIVPNVVDEKLFYPINDVAKEPFFFMVSYWKSPKDPITAMNAFMDFSRHKSGFSLLIGGYGPLFNKMHLWIEEHNMHSKVKLLGRMTSAEVAHHMQRCHAFIHPSSYETFSVVCAEAVSCGALVIAPDVGGISEVIGNNGLLVSMNKESELIDAMHTSTKRKTPITSDTRFTRENVGRVYFRALNNIIHGITE